MCMSESTGVISLAKPVKKGFLQRYKKRFIGSNWRKFWIVLHEDSSLEWYKDDEEDNFEGGVLLKEAPEMIAAGPFANYVPGKPELPLKDSDPNCLMAFGNKKKEKINWFMASNLDDLNQWMTAISNTLPPPPKPPEEAPTQPSNPGLAPPQPDALPPAYSPHPTAPPQPTNPVQNNSNQRGGLRPQGYDRHQSNNYGGYSPNMMQGGPNQYGGGGRQQYGGGQNTVIVDRRDGGMGDFASGMFMGAAMSGWGTGYGWGLGPSIGYGFGGWGFGAGFGGPRYGGYGGAAQDVNVVNNINIDNENTGEQNGNTNEEPSDVSNGEDPGMESGVDPPGLEPDAEVFDPSSINPPDAEPQGLEPDAEVFDPSSLNPPDTQPMGLEPDAEVFDPATLNPPDAQPMGLEPDAEVFDPATLNPSDAGGYNPDAEMFDPNSGMEMGGGEQFDMGGVDGGLYEGDGGGYFEGDGGGGGGFFEGDGGGGGFFEGDGGDGGGFFGGDGGDLFGGGGGDFDMGGFDF